MEYLYILQQAIVFIITVFWLYQLLISICSFVKLKDKPMLTDKKHKFMAIIPAHNEEAVIGNLIESLNNQSYPRELFDIYVIADNCTDRTKEIAREIALNGIYEGKVTKIMNFGAFIDIGGGKEGLLHISKISKERVEKIEDVLSVGDRIIVKVLDIDNQGKISLKKIGEQEG